MKTKNMGWECPKCGNCYAPTIEICFMCPGTTVKPDVLEELHQVSLSGGGTGEKPSTTLTSTGFITTDAICSTGTNTISFSKPVPSMGNATTQACLSFVKQGASKYCATCGVYEKNHPYLSH